MKTCTNNISCIQIMRCNPRKQIIELWNHHRTKKDTPNVTINLSLPVDEIYGELGTGICTECLRYFFKAIQVATIRKLKRFSNDPFLDVKSYIKSLYPKIPKIINIISKKK